MFKESKVSQHLYQSGLEGTRLTSSSVDGGHNIDAIPGLDAVARDLTPKGSGVADGRTDSAPNGSKWQLRKPNPR